MSLEWWSLCWLIWSLTPKQSWSMCQYRPLVSWSLLCLWVERHNLLPWDQRAWCARSVVVGHWVSLAQTLCTVGIQCKLGGSQYLGQARSICHISVVWGHWHWSGHWIGVPGVPIWSCCQWVDILLLEHGPWVKCWLSTACHSQSWTLRLDAWHIDVLGLNHLQIYPVNAL